MNPLVDVSADAPWARSIYVYDADTGDPIPGAVVTCEHLTTDLWDDEFPDPAYRDTSGTSGLSDGSGYVYSELSPGNHKLTASASGYDPTTQTELISYGTEDPAAPIKIYLNPARGDINLPKVFLKTPDGSGGFTRTTTQITPAKITLTKITTNPTASWNGGQPSLTGNSDDPVTLPRSSRFKLVSFTYGYSTDEAIYIETDSSGNVKWYSDPDFASAHEIVDPAKQALWAAALDEPTYTLSIYDKDSAGVALPKGDYRVTVDLQYIKATEGSFGIKYDPALFTVNPVVGGDLTINTSEIDVVRTVEDMYDPGTWSNTNGYFNFSWQAAGGVDAVFDTELTRKNIIELIFHLKDPADADAPSYDWFNIEVWTDTLADQTLPASDPAHLMHWRPCDADNNVPVQPGRIEASKAIINGVDTGGFFQATVNGDLAGGTAATSFYDVKTVLDYKIDINNSVLYFHVYDDATSADLDSADVDVYNYSPSGFVQQKTSGSDGMAKFYINTSTGLYGPTFAYTVSRLGYWPVPADGLVSSRPTVTAPTGVVTKVPVPMKKKIYHVPVVTNTDITGVGDHDLGGEKYAYNGRDFHFRAKAAKGYRIVTYPSTAKVTIWDESSASQQPLYLTLPVNPLDGYFTIPAADLNQRTLEDMYTNLYSQYTMMTTAESAYYDDIFTGLPFNPTGGPDAEGFRSYNIYIEFENFTCEEISYQVEGVTNDQTLGTVTYIPGSGDVGEVTSVGTDEYRLVKTLTGSAANRKTGTFHFEAVPGSGATIEKVYINGIRSYGYDGETEMDYTFGEVDMDCNITVIFWDGTNHSTDKLMTLVVGEYGYVTPNSANHIEPSPNKITNTRRVYLNKGGLDFDWGTDYPVYELNKVEKELETSGATTRTTITSATNNYVITETAGENTIVYVTFKHENASPDTTPNLFVKSYVMQGQGKVTDAGVLIYCLYDRVDIDLVADRTNAPYSAKGVELQDFDTLAQTGTYDFSLPYPLSGTYTYPSLTDNIAIGAVFVEPTLNMTGQIDYSQNASVTLGNCLTGGTVRFMRLDGSMNEIPGQVPYIFNTTNARKTATFSASIPAGWWNVYFEKPGYVTYKITEFHMDSSVTSFGGTQKVVPYIGSTMGGKYVLLVDAANIRSGWRTGANSVIKDQADVDNDGAVQNYDLIYVWHNYNKRLTEQTYNDFCSLGSPALTGAAPF